MWPKTKSRTAPRHQLTRCVLFSVAATRLLSYRGFVTKDLSSSEIIRTPEEFAAVMRRRRIELGKTCLWVDRRAGFHLGYTGHLEHPGGENGRSAVHQSMEYWLGALDVAVVVIPMDGALSWGALSKLLLTKLRRHSRYLGGRK